MEDVIEFGQSSYEQQRQLLGKIMCDEFMGVILKITLFSRYAIETLNFSFDGDDVPDWMTKVRPRIRMTSFKRAVIRGLISETELFHALSEFRR